MSKKLILTFIAMGIGIMVIAVDIAAINVALPAVEKAFEITIGTVEWIVNGYMLAFAVLMVTCGRLADMYGRRKIFFIGLIIFGVASLIGGLSDTSGSLITARVFQGVGAAFLWPSIVGICYSSVTESQKSYAVGLLIGAVAIGNGAGPLIGGLLTEYLSWRWVLFINLPLAITAGLITLFVVPEQSAEGEERGIDFLGILTISFSIVSLLIAIDQSSVWGWSSIKTIGLILLFLVLLTLFINIEQKQRTALIPNDVMHNTDFMLKCVVMAAVIPTFFCILLYLPQYLEKFRNFSPLGSGAALVPMLLSFAITSPISGKIYNSLGGKLSIFIGVLLTSIGAFFTAIFGFGDNYFWIIPGLIIVGIGIGISVPSITTAAVGSVRESRASLAGGIVFMFQLAGAALGLAIITTIFTDVASEDLINSINSAGIQLSESELERIKRFVLGSGSESTLVSKVGKSIRDNLITHVEHSYIEGVKNGLVVSGLLALFGAVISLISVKNRDVFQR
ncbi:MAG: MFS transporter [Thermodesulfobacteriota bacterium]